MTMMNLKRVVRAAVCPPLDGPWATIPKTRPNYKKCKRVRARATRSHLSPAWCPLSCQLLAKIIHVTWVDTAIYGMKVGFAVWLGFVTTVQLTANLFGNQSTKLYLINTG